MANPRHLKLLRKGATRWNLAREQRPDLIPDLMEADLSGALLVEQKPIDLTMADLRGADLSHANLSVIARDADLSGANLAGANIAGDFSGSNLNGANLTGANLIGIDFSGAVFTRADLTQADLATASLSGSNLRGAILRNANLTAVNLQLADLTLADLTGSNLRDADLSGANLELANLTWADFSGSNLCHANLTGANLLNTTGLRRGATTFQVFSIGKSQSKVGGTNIAIERILCPVDFSEVSVKAYVHAQSIARQYGAELIVQHVLESRHRRSCNGQVETLMFNTKLQLRHFVDQYRELEPRCIIEENEAADESIVSLARTQAVSLIVMGTNGWRGLNHLLLGSVAESVLRNAPCPVLAIHKDGSGLTNPFVQVRHILCCIDFSAHSQRALGHALSVAKAYDADVSVLHVLEDISAESPDLEEEMNACLDRLQKLIDPSAIASTKIHLEMRQGEACREILKFAAEKKSDMIVTGVRGRNSLNLAVFGSITHRLLQLYPGHVLTVPI